MVNNAKLRTIVIDSYGDEKRGQWIPCNIRMATGDKRAKSSDGTYPSVSYVVIADMSRQLQDFDGVEMIDSRGVNLGDFALNSFEHIALFSRDKMVVSLSRP